ncbi:PilZ domain-containing protein [Solimicrobium silvestre]|uniref:PilZ domain n=1 Tax=Solimicrobium silvestre TaxID=2099400 RepID=A0A2S9H301_9BURK|nr:PilZ domain-containing protein [Solimicrobium silvestre]PRC94313.1 PilZ domain [Solimicrobium silvestre]
MTTMTITKEGRSHLRRILHCKVKVISKNGSVLVGRSIDISLTGISVMLDEPFDHAPQCIIMFEALSANQLTSSKLINVTVNAEAVYSICVGTTGFRVGFKFDRINEEALKSLRLLLA